MEDVNRQLLPVCAVLMCGHGWPYLPPKRRPLRLAVSRLPWSPDIHILFPPAFRRACRALLLAACRSGGTLQQPGAVASGVLGLQPPAHLGSLPADALLLIMQQAAYPLSLWAALECIPPATVEAEEAMSVAPRPGGAAALASAPAVGGSSTPTALPAPPSVVTVVPAASATSGTRPPPPPPSSMAADVADAVAAFQAALGGGASAGGSSAGAVSAAGPSAPASNTSGAAAVPIPNELSQGLAALSFSTHSGPFVFGGSG